MRKITAVFWILACLATVLLAGCSPANGELARQREERLRQQREVERAKEEQRQRIAERKAAEEAGKQAQETPEAKEKPDYLAKKRTINVSSEKVTAVAVSPDGSLLACGTAEGKLKVFILDGGLKMAVKEHTAAVKSLAFSSDSSTLYSGAADETLVVWDIAAGKVRRKERGFFKTIDGLSVAPDGTAIAAGDGRRVYILDNAAHITKKLESEAYGIRSVIFTADSQDVVSSSDGKLIEVWHTSSGIVKYGLKRHGGAVTCLSIDKTGKELLSGGADKMLVTWDLEKGKEKRVYLGHRDEVTGVRYTADGKHLLSSDASGWLLVWKRDTGKVLSRVRAHEDSIESIALSNDGKTLFAASGDGTVSVWEIDTER